MALASLGVPLRIRRGSPATQIDYGIGMFGVQSPFDRGAAPETGLRGVLWSLPELVFVNVRTGSVDHVACRDWPDAPPWRESPPPSPP